MCPSPSVHRNYTSFCHNLKSCTSCTSTTSSCVWCGKTCAWKECPAPKLSWPQPSALLNDGSSSPPKSGKTSVKALTSVEQCEESNQQTPLGEKCSQLHTCHSCSAQEGCMWEIDKSSQCKEAKKSTKSKGNLTEEPG